MPAICKQKCFIGGRLYAKGEVVDSPPANLPETYFDFTGKDAKKAEEARKKAEAAKSGKDNKGGKK